MLDFVGFLFDLLMLGDWLDRVAGGDAAEGESRFYDAPQMRRLRWTAWAVVLVYTLAMAALPVLVAAAPDGSLVRASRRWIRRGGNHSLRRCPVRRIRPAAPHLPGQAASDRRAARRLAARLNGRAADGSRRVH